MRFFLGLAVTLAMGQAAMGEGTVEKRAFGVTNDGKAVDQYVLTNGHGLQARVMTYGATWTHMLVPDRDGKMGDVLLGFDTLPPYLAGHPYFGSIAGRVANRIAKGKFSLDGKDYTLATNNGPNHLHGGEHGTDKAVWRAESFSAADGPGVKFTYTDPGGNNGYPGTVKMQVTYTLTNKDEMKIDYLATTDQATPINLTNHAYFNLGTAAAGSILDHVLYLHADRYTPMDDTLIPTGEIVSVKDTPWDFTVPTPIGKNIEKAGGYDHNFVVNGRPGSRRDVGRVVDPHSGRAMQVQSDQPGVQFYTGNFLDGTLTGKDGVTYQKNQAFCLETQHYPDSIHQPKWPDSVLRPGHDYRTTSVYKFSVDK